MNPIHQQGTLLTSCDQEPIRMPGSVQPHGVLLVLSTTGHLVRHASENIDLLSARQAREITGLPLAEVLDAATRDWILARLGSTRLEARPAYLGVMTCRANRYEVLGHCTDELLFLEFEQLPPEADDHVSFFYPLITKFVGLLAEARTIEEMSTLAVQEVKSLTGFGRVLLYKFDAIGNGHVLAEQLSPNYPSYLHQRFPSADIPQQARELYIANRVRLIADANYVPVRLLPEYDAGTGQPVDLSHAGLRSVSPVHIEYMKNMGTMASMSISIVVRGRLWGLISCHNIEPQRVRFETRAICEQLGQVIAVHFEAAEEREEFNHRMQLRGRLVRLLGSLSKPDDFASNLRNVQTELLDFAQAQGAALVMGEKITCFGNTPDVAQIAALTAWLAKKNSPDIFSADVLSREFAPALDFREVASGLLAISISQLHEHYLMWFRPEIIKTITWAGNPGVKTPSPDMSHLSPRRSFEEWRETVHATSAAWRQSELETALEFRNAILGIVLRRAEEMAELADSLGRANKELESFSYSVSHDLRSPLRHIVGFADMLAEMEQDKLSEKSHRFIRNIKSSAQFAGKLVDDLLSFSHMGRAALHVSQVDMNEVVSASIDRLTQEMSGRKIEWDIATLPTIQGDPRFLGLAVHNLLANAVKYSRTRNPATIRIYAVDQGDNVEFSFTDNGVGFDATYVHKLFHVFQRLHRMEEFEGTGIGLANVKRIIERHGGTVAAHGEVGQGATFSISLPKIQLQKNGEAC